MDSPAFRAHVSAAPLKSFRPARLPTPAPAFPRSRERGPIEVIRVIFEAGNSRAPFPRSRERGPIEVGRNVERDATEGRAGFPRSRERGPIEVVIEVEHVASRPVLSALT